jgi:protein TonB
MFAMRVPFAALAGALFSAAIFVGLSQLVGVPFDVEPLVEARRIEYTQQRKDTPVIDKRREKVTRDPPIVTPGPTKISRGGGDGNVVRFERVRVDPVIRTDGPGLRGIDGDVTPIVRTTPEYPPRAAAANVEGWVQVRFSVTPSGSVRDAVVVSSEPGTTFDEAALKAIARWRYHPRIENGVAVERVGLQTVIRFQLED